MLTAMLRRPVAIAIVAGIVVGAILTSVLVARHQAPALHQRWHQLIGFTLGAAGPSVADGLVLSVTNAQDVEAFDASTGAPRWRWSGGRRVLSPVIAADGAVYVIQEGVRPLENRVCAITARDGTHRWCLDTGLPPSVTASGGLAFIGRERVQAVDAMTGQPRWERDLPELRESVVLTAVGPSLFAGTGERLEYDTDSDRRPSGPGGPLFSLDPATGTVRWKADGPYLGWSVVGAGTSIYAGSAVSQRDTAAPARLDAIDAGTGRVQWQTKLPAQVSAAPALAGGTAFVPSGDKDTSSTNAKGWLSAVTLETGRLRWTAELPEPKSYPPAVAAGTVLTPVLGDLRIYDATTGRRLERVGRDVLDDSQLAASGPDVYAIGDCQFSGIATACTGLVALEP